MGGCRPYASNIFFIFPISNVIHAPAGPYAMPMQREAAFQFQVQIQPPPLLSSEWPTQIIHNIQRVTLSKVKLPCSAKSCLRALLSMLGQQNFEITRPIGLEHDQANSLHAFVNSIKMQHCIFLSRLKSDTIFTPSGLSIQHRKSAVGVGAKFVPFLSFHSKD